MPPNVVRLPAMRAARLASIPLLCALAASAHAQSQSPGGPRTGLTRANGGGMVPGRGFAVPFWIGEREVVHEVVHEVIREVPAAPPPPAEPPPSPRKPYVIGASYASLPGGCMKMVEAGGAYFYCSGEWYRQLGAGYQAVREP